ncbi:MAG: tetraacyldisaccharide 4'-kinase, partial [Pseudomonadota bacterium]
SILLVDDSGLDQRQRVFPAGRLREPIARATARADIIVRVSTTTPNAPIIPGEEWPSKSSGAFFTTARTIPTRTIDSSRKYLAFSGIARPQRFIASLKGAGLNLIDAVSFPDHHPFSESELSMLRKRAEDVGATLITTEKDFVRLSQEQQNGIATFGIEIEFDQATQLVQRISETIKANRGMTSFNV